MNFKEIDESKRKADIILLSCTKYKNGNESNGHSSDSWEKIKKNFGSNLLFIFYGNPNQTDLFNYNENLKELSIRTSDEYDNIPVKTWLAYYFWYYHITDKKKHLITFGDDCKLENEQLFIVANFDDVDYGGIRIHGPNWNNKYHQKKVKTTSFQYNKISPRPTKQTQWIHEGTGVVFSKSAIQSLLKKHNWDEHISESVITTFADYVKKTCWYNDVLLSHEFDNLNIKIKQIKWFGIKGDK